MDYQNEFVSIHEFNAFMFMYSKIWHRSGNFSKSMNNYTPAAAHLKCRPICNPFLFFVSVAFHQNKHWLLTSYICLCLGNGIGDGHSEGKALDNSPI